MVRANACEDVLIREPGARAVRTGLRDGKLPCLRDTRVNRRIADHGGHGGE